MGKTASLREYMSDIARSNSSNNTSSGGTNIIKVLVSDMTTDIDSSAVIEAFKKGDFIVYVFNNGQMSVQLTEIEFDNDVDNDVVLFRYLGTAYLHSGKNVTTP